MAHIVVHMENGALQRISSDDPSLRDSCVVVVEDTTPDRVLMVEHDQEIDRDVLRLAKERSACEGVSIACDLAGERLLKIAKTRYVSTHKVVDDVQRILKDLVELVNRAVTDSIIE